MPSADALIAPETGPKVQALIPGSQLIWFRQTSHFIQVEKPEELIREILEFEKDGDNRET